MRVLARSPWPSRLGWLSSALPLILLSGCAATPPKPDPESLSGPSRHQAVDPLALEDDGADGDGMTVQGTLGTLDEEAIQAGMQPSLIAVSRCFQQQVARQPYLGGELTLQFRVGRDGATKTVRLGQSNLGSLAVERCVVASVQDARFERPRGGEAEFTYPLKFQGRVATTSWDADTVKQQMLEHVDELLAAVNTDDPPLQAPAGLCVTFYVDSRGKVLSAGMTAKEAFSPDFADRFVENLQQLSFEPASGGYTKVTYPW